MASRLSISKLFCPCNAGCLLLLIVIAITLRLTGALNNASIDDFNRLINATLTSHSSYLRPVTNQSQPVNVEVTFNLLGLVDIEEVNKKIHINAWFNMTWHDEIRTWKPSEYGGIDALHPNRNDIWCPKIIISNSLGSKDVFEEGASPLTLWSDGLTSWFPGTLFSLTCELDMTYFPFDEQRCYLKFLSKEMRQFVLFHFSEKGLTTGEFTTNGEWDLKDYKTSVRSFDTTRWDVHALVVCVVFERRAMFHLVTIIIPVMFISFFAFFSFLIPEDSGERCSFANTVLLALEVYMTVVTQQIPADSQTFPIIAIFIFSLFLLSGLCVIAILMKIRIQQLMCKSPDTPSSVQLENSGRVLQNINKSNDIIADDFNDKRCAKIRVHTKTTDLTAKAWGMIDEKKEYTKACENNEPSNDIIQTMPLKSGCGYWKGQLNVLRNGDAQLFMIFVFIWACVTVYYFTRLVTRS